MAAARSTRWGATLAPALALLLAAWASPARAQNLVVSPDCGVAGQTLVTIKGSSWPEPDPPCEYVFYFNGVEVAPRQDDGLYGPPLASFTVPAVSPGKYRVRVELRITETQALRACREADFCVIAQEKDPWADAMNVNGNTMNIKFDPTDVCDVTPCQSIVLIQSINLKGQIGTDPPGELQFAQFGRRYRYLDANRVKGVTMDTYAKDRDAYYNGERDVMDQKLGHDGLKSCEFSVTSEMRDTPVILEAAIPPGGTVIMEFEVNAFCARGDDRGSWLGNVTWTWSRTHGQPPVITPGTKSRTGPSGNFSSALSGWNTSHGFSLPTPKAPTSGGKPCH